MSIEHIPGIYSITNAVNGKKYIGSSIDVNNRLVYHECALRHGRHHNKHLQRAWDKYGSDSFRFEVIQTCCVDELLDIEQEWIDCTEDLYNMCPFSHSTLGREMTDEHKKKISRSNMGHSVTDEMREKFRENYKSNKKIQEYIKSKKGDSEYWKSIGFTREGIAKPKHKQKKIRFYFGCKHTDEWKRKISESNKGISRNWKVNDDEVIEIKKLYKSGKYTQCEIGEMFKIDQAAISRIINNKSHQAKKHKQCR